MFIMFEKPLGLWYNVSTEPLYHAAASEYVQLSAYGGSPYAHLSQRLRLWYNRLNDLPPEVAAKQECVRITLQNT